MMSPDGTAQELAARADALLEDARPAEAFELYDEAVDLDPDDPSLVLRAGLALMQATEFHVAYLYLEQAHHAYPDDTEILRFMGACALAGGQGPLALEAFEKMRELGGETPAQTLLDMAVAAYYALRVPDAKEYVAEALELDPESKEAAEWKARLDGYESDHDLIVDVALAHCREGRLGVGAALFTHAFEFGDSFEARYYGGQAMLGVGRADDAAALLEAASDMQPDNEDVAEALEFARTILEDAEAGRAEGAQDSDEDALEVVRGGTAAAEEAPRAAFCSQCGRELKPDAAFCPACGRRVG